jgi:hypothetical protein
MGAATARRVGRPPNDRTSPDLAVPTSLTLTRAEIDWLDRERAATGETRSGAMKRVVRFLMSANISLTDISGGVGAALDAERGGAA